MHQTLPSRPGSGQKVEHEYKRKDALCDRAAWDVRRAHIFDRCAPKDGIEPLDALPASVRWCSTSPSGRDIVAGQHVDMPLRPTTGYQAQRSYPIASRRPAAWP